MAFLFQEREYIRTTNLCLFLEMSMIVEQYNQTIEAIVATRELLKANKEQVKIKFQENQATVSRIQELKT